LQIVTASFDKTARIWRADTGAQVKVLHGHDDLVMTAAFSPDGTRVVTASLDKTARVWDSRTGSQLLLLAGHDAGIFSAAYSPDGRRIVTASMDKTARIWDAFTGALLLVLSGHGDIVDSATYAPDGGRIVTASHDRTARIWDARSGMQLAVLAGHTERVTSAVFSPDGTEVLTASMDKTARIWRAHVQAGLEAQIAWFEAAQTDPLTETDRVELGLAEDGGEVQEVGSSAPGRPSRILTADTEKPESLGRFAEQEEREALGAADAQSRRSKLLQAFRHKAAAAERAQHEHRPIGDWAHWRYRRASIALVLSDEGMMQAVAENYRAVLDDERSSFRRH